MDQYWNLFWATGLPEAWALSRRGEGAGPAASPQRRPVPAPPPEARPSAAQAPMAETEAGS